MKDPSLLRFMVDLRGADLSDKQLRDDLMTMLIAGHETTAAVLTWALFLLMQNPDIQERAVAEVQAVLPDWSRDELGMPISVSLTGLLLFPISRLFLLIKGKILTMHQEGKRMTMRIQRVTPLKFKFAVKFKCWDFKWRYISGQVIVAAGLEQIKELPYLRAILAESLRLYPQPPILIRRALGEDTLPAPLNGDPKGYPISKGADLFISVWNLHR